MNTLYFHPSRFVRALITLVIWLMAAVTMSGCLATKHAAISTATSIEGMNKGLTSNTSNIAIATTDAAIAKEDTDLKTTQATPISAYQKKKQFFALLKPIVVAENSALLKQRQHILEFKEHKHLNANDINTLQHIAQQYKLKFPKNPQPKDWQVLLNRVDIVPVELALVQAANESAWGTSFFARQGNNYFGQWCYQKGCGIVPRQRNTGATHEVKRFKSVRGSVHAYMRNINTSRAYADLRKMRSNLRKRNIPIHAEILTRGLIHYSERGTAYVKTLRKMIRRNRELMQQAPST